MRLYFRTSAFEANAILSGGFHDTAGWRADQEYPGVWLANVDLLKGNAGTVLLAVDLLLPDAAIAEFEWSGEGRRYREYLIPAAVLNANATVVEER
jgi:hypothetical protein